jgi:hypothetical protein
LTQCRADRWRRVGLSGGNLKFNLSNNFFSHKRDPRVQRKGENRPWFKTRDKENFVLFLRGETVVMRYCRRFSRIISASSRSRGQVTLKFKPV